MEGIARRAESGLHPEVAFEASEVLDLAALPLAGNEVHRRRVRRLLLQQRHHQRRSCAQ